MKCPWLVGENSRYYGKGSKFGVQLLSKEDRAKTRHVLNEEDEARRLVALRTNPPVLGKRWKLVGDALENNRRGKAKMWITRRAKAKEATECPTQP